MNILIIEDEVNLGQTLQEYLTLKGYQSEWVSSCKQATQIMQMKHFDLCLFDIGLPDGSGLELAKDFYQKNSKLIFLFLSAQNDPSIRVQGLEIGAQDYITKPFDLRELSLRLENIINKNTIIQTTPGLIQHGNLKIWFERYQLEDAQGNKISLGNKECGILKLLYEYRNSVVSRDKIIDEVWGKDSFPSQRTVDNYIVSLRKWSDTEPGSIKITTVRGIGYQLEVKG